MRNFRLLLGVAMLALPVSSIPAPVLAAQAETTRVRVAVEALCRWPRPPQSVVGDIARRSSLRRQVTDISAAGRAKRRRSDRRCSPISQRIDRKALSRDNQVDAAAARQRARYDIWDAETLESWAWNPQVYNDVAGSSLYTLAARDFAPWPQRLNAATARMEALPALPARRRAPTSSRRGCRRSMRRPSPKQNSGIVEHRRGACSRRTRANCRRGPQAVRRRAGQPEARRSPSIRSGSTRRWCPARRATSASARSSTTRSCSFALISTLTRTEIKATRDRPRSPTRARRCTRSRARCWRASRARRRCPTRRRATQQQAAIEAALDLTYAKRPARDGMIDAATKATLAQRDRLRPRARASSRCRRAGQDHHHAQVPAGRRGRLLRLPRARSTRAWTRSSRSRRSPTTGPMRRRRRSCANITAT